MLSCRKIITKMDLELYQNINLNICRYDLKTNTFSGLFGDVFESLKGNSFFFS